MQRLRPDVTSCLLDRMSHPSNSAQAFGFAQRRPRGQETITPSGFHSLSASTAPPPPPPPPPPPYHPYPLPVPQAAHPFVQPQHPYIYPNYCNQAAPLCLNNVPTPCPPPLAGTKRQRVEEPAASRSRSFACDPCSLTFESKSALDAHVSSHVTCTACSFRASPKAVKAHHQAAHGKFSGTGFKTITVAIPGCPVQRYRICVGNRPEDIAAWIAERKRRFPRRSAKLDDGAQANQLGQVSRNETSGTTPTNATASPSPAQGLSSLLDGYGSSSDEETEEKMKESPTPALPPQHDESVVVPSDAKLGRNNGSTDSHVASDRRYKRPCRFFARHGNCRNGEECPFSHDVANSGPAKLRNDRTENKSSNRSAPPSLLEKLLANDVRRERILTIQLLEHIAGDANFFLNAGGVGSASNHDS